ncbi:MAG: hypothetical protein QM715_04410 [Nibricoccus sp.]
MKPKTKRPPICRWPGDIGGREEQIADQSGKADTSSANADALSVDVHAFSVGVEGLSDNVGTLIALSGRWSTGVGTSRVNDVTWSSDLAAPISNRSTTSAVFPVQSVDADTLNEKFLAQSCDVRIPSGSSAERLSGSGEKVPKSPP